MVCVVAAAGLGFVLVREDGDSADTATPEPTVTATSEATPTPTETTPEPTTPEPTEEPVERTAPVSIFNNTGIQGLAGSFSAEVEAAGWTLGTIGDWNGQIVSNTVYFPPALEEQAHQLADDVGIDRLRPAFEPMGNDRLTIILSGPQQ